MSNTKVHSIARLGEQAPVRVFAPIAYAVAAQIESWPLAEFLAEPTRLVKGLSALQQTLGTDVIFCAASAAIESEALGAGLDWSAYPPRVMAGSASGKTLPEDPSESLTQGARLAASVEAARRMTATLRGTPALGVALTGVATLAAELCSAGFVLPSGLPDDDDGWLEYAGRVLLAAAKACMLAGVSLVLLLEHELPPQSQRSHAAWLAAMKPLANLANFHKALVAVVPRAGGEQTPRPVQLPPWLKTCLSSQWQRTGAGNVGSALFCDALEVEAAAGPLVTTVTEIPATTAIEALRRVQ